jgi:hypothetical protein
MRRVWKLQELKRRHEDGYMSRRMRVEYDCKQEPYRILAASTHSEPMAGGKVLITEEGPSGWQEIAPGTVAETMLEIVCAK